MLCTPVVLLDLGLSSDLSLRFDFQHVKVSSDLGTLCRDSRSTLQRDYQNTGNLDINQVETGYETERHQV